MDKYFWFFKKEKSADYLSDTLIAVMRTSNGPDYMKTRDCRKRFHIKSKVVKEIVEIMKYKHTDNTLNSLLRFIERIYKEGYSMSKYKYIRDKRPDIMKAITIIETNILKYLNKKHALEMSMYFQDIDL